MVQVIYFKTMEEIPNQVKLLNELGYRTVAGDAILDSRLTQSDLLEDDGDFPAIRICDKERKMIRYGSHSFYKDQGYTLSEANEFLKIEAAFVKIKDEFKRKYQVKFKLNSFSGRISEEQAEVLISEGLGEWIEEKS